MTLVAGYCTLCRSRCGAAHEISDGRLVKVVPLPTHPTGGALCAKGRAAPELLYSPRRLATPLRRTSPRDAATPSWEPVGWDQALDEIARRLSEIRDRHGAHAVAFAATTPSGTPIVDSFEWIERFVRCFGSPNLIYAVEICGWHKDYAHKLTYGRSVGVMDWAHAEVIVLWGHNPARTWLAQASRIAEARQRGARVVVIDPKPDGSGQQADLWLRIRPGADAALALGAIRHLLRTRRFDADFLRNWSNAPLLVDLDTRRLLRANELWPHARDDAWVLMDAQGQSHAYDTRDLLDAALPVDLHARGTIRDARGQTRQVATSLTLLADAVAAYTPARVAELTWIDASLITQFNALFEHSPKLAYHCWTGVGQHSNATATERAIGTLYALTGACDAPGGNLWTVPPPSPKINDYGLLDPAQQAKALGLAELPLGPPSQGWITARDFARAVLQHQPYAVRALFSFGGNLLTSQANTERNRQALLALDFQVHVDTFMTPGAAYADFVLPSTLPWEREALKIGFEISQAAAEHVQLRPRMVAPYAEARNDYDIVMDLALRLGMTEPFFQGDMVAAWNHQLAPMGLDVATLRRSPGGVRVRQPFSHRKYARPVDAAPDGRQVQGFDTPTRRVEIYSETLLNVGQSPLAEFVEPADSPLRVDADARYPLVLTTAKTGWFIHSSLRHVSSLRKKALYPSVQIGANLARERGIAPGDWIHLSTPGGEVVMQATISPRLDDRTVIAEFGWWEGAPAFGQPALALTGPASSNINGILSDDKRDPVSGSVPLRAITCNIQRHAERNRGRWQGTRAFRIVSHRLIATRIAHIELAPRDGQALPDYLPGQHVTVHVPQAGQRSYSLVGPTQSPNTLSIAVKRDGHVSALLHDMKAGERLDLGAPSGNFILPLRGDRPLLLIASGIGITPFISHLESLLAQGDDSFSDGCPDATLLYVCRDGPGHAFAERIRAIAARLPSLTVRTFYRAPLPGDRPSIDYDAAGKLDLGVLPPDWLARRPLAYLCGSPGFLAQTTQALIAHGIPAFDIFTETFLAEAAVPPELAAQPVVIADSAQQFIWRPAAGSLLDAATAAGVMLPNGCRVGQCESCMVRVASGRVHHLIAYDGPPDTCLTCQAVPLSPVTLQTSYD